MLHFNGRSTALISLLVLSQAAFFALSAMNNITVEKVEKTGLPILYIETTAAKNIKSKTKYIDAVYSLASGHNFQHKEQGKCKIRGRGNTTWKTRELIKKPYLLKLGDAAPLLGMKAAHKWILIANAADKTQLRNAYALHLASTVFDGNIATPQCAFVQLFLNGRYGGLYLLTEKSGFEDGRLDEFGVADGAGGSFVAEVRGRGGKQINFETAHGVPFSVRSPKVAADDASAINKRCIECFDRAQQPPVEMMCAYCKDILQAAEDSIYSSVYTAIESTDSTAVSSTDWGGRLDLMSFVDWYWVNELTKNHDAHFQSSCFMVWDAQRERLFMGPVWDFDISCGNVSSDGCENPEGLWICERQWFNVLMEKDAVFQKAVWARWHEKRGEAEKSLEWLEEEASRLSAAIELDERVYPKIGRRQWPHPPRWKERRTYRAELDYMKDFLRQRIEWLSGAANMPLENISSIIWKE